MTDKQRLLGFFRSNPNREVDAYTEIVGVDGLRILEYTGRISDVRKDLGCTCGEEPLYCQATEHIINTRKGYYKFVTKEVEKPAVEVDLATLQARRELLAKAWVKAKADGDKVTLAIIEGRGKIIRNMIEVARVKEALT